MLATGFIFDIYSEFIQIVNLLIEIHVVSKVFQGVSMAFTLIHLNVFHKMHRMEAWFQPVNFFSHPPIFIL